MRWVAVAFIASTLKAFWKSFQVAPWQAIPIQTHNFDICSHIKEKLHFLTFTGFFSVGCHAYHLCLSTAACIASFHPSRPYVRTNVIQESYFRTFSFRFIQFQDAYIRYISIKLFWGVFFCWSFACLLVPSKMLLTKIIVWNREPSIIFVIITIKQRTKCVQFVTEHKAIIIFRVFEQKLGEFIMSVFWEQEWNERTKVCFFCSLFLWFGVFLLTFLFFFFLPFWL